jgi:hypothetical protein
MLCLLCAHIVFKGNQVTLTINCGFLRGHHHNLFFLISLHHCARVFFHSKTDLNGPVISAFLLILCINIPVSLGLRGWKFWLHIANSCTILVHIVAK